MISPIFYDKPNFRKTLILYFTFIPDLFYLPHWRCRGLTLHVISLSLSHTHTHTHTYLIGRTPLDE